MYRGLSYARKSEASFSTLDYGRILRDFPEEGSLKIQVKKIEEKTYVFSISLFHFAWGALFRTSVAVQGTQRGSGACPLHLLCKCGVPAYRFRAVEQLTLAVAP